MEVERFRLALTRRPTIEARLFREEEVPWEQLAFRTVRETLERYFEDRRRGVWGVHSADI